MDHSIFLPHAWLKVWFRQKEERLPFTRIMYVAPAVNETLAPDDAGKILEELLEAQNHSVMLGLGLNLRLHEVEAIKARYSDPRERLLYIIIAFLRQAEPRPTWRVILEALRNPIVNLPALARSVEAAHYPILTATRQLSIISGRSPLTYSYTVSAPPTYSSSPGSYH